MIIDAKKRAVVKLCVSKKENDLENKRVNNAVVYLGRW
jgi:hypothetical protein